MIPFVDAYVDKVDLAGKKHRGGLAAGLLIGCELGRCLRHGTMRFDIITLFPELFAPFLESGVTRAPTLRARWRCICGIRVTTPRATTAVWMIAPSAAAPAW
jgi:hypothetical protein